MKGSLVFQVHYHTAYFLSLQVMYTPICKHLTLPMRDFIDTISIDCQAPLYLTKIRSGCCRRNAKALKRNLDKWLFYSFYVTHICFLCHHFHKQKPPNAACYDTKLRVHSINCFSSPVTSFGLFLLSSSIYPDIIQTIRYRLFIPVSFLLQEDCKQPSPLFVSEWCGGP